MDIGKKSVVGMNIREKSVLRMDIGEKSVVGEILPDILSPPLLCSMLVADPPSIHSLLTRFDQQEPDLTNKNPICKFDQVSDLTNKVQTVDKNIL